MYRQQMGFDLFGIKIDTSNIEAQAKAAALAELAKQTASDPNVQAQLANQASQSLATKLISDAKARPMLYGGIALAVGIAAFYGVSAMMHKR